MKKKKLPSLVSILILTLITVFFWVAFDVYRLFTKPSDAVVPESISLPLNPVLDQNALDKLKQSVYFEDSQIEDFVINTSLAVDTPEEVSTETPVSSPSAFPDPLESPTP